jgi:hypothetical protein
MTHEWNQIEPYTDPALEHLGQFLADRLNELTPKSVQHWIVSEMLSYSPGDYPLMQLQCLESGGEALQNCRGSVRYALLNQQVVVGDRQQLGFRFIQRAIAQALRQYEALNDWDAPMILGDLSILKADTRTGPLKAADGSIVGSVTWTEIFFEYTDRADIDAKPYA